MRQEREAPRASQEPATRVWLLSLSLRSLQSQLLLAVFQTACRCLGARPPRRSLHPRPALPGADSSGQPGQAPELLGCLLRTRPSPGEAQMLWGFSSFLQCPLTELCALIIRLMKIKLFALSP